MLQAFVMVLFAGAARTTSAAASVEHAAGGHLGAELAQAKRREAEASTRVAALEAKLKSSSSVHGEMQASVQELSHRLQVCTISADWPGIVKQIYWMLYTAANTVCKCNPMQYCLQLHAC